MVAKRDFERTPTIPSEDGIMELSFLISLAQFAALEQAAQTASLTVAQYLRQLVQCSLDLSTNRAPKLTA
jgi:hypothetical protein